MAIGFTLWAFLPLDNEYGLYYLPDRYYILGISNWFIFTVYINCACLYFIGMIKSPLKSSYFTMVDKFTILRPYKQNTSQHMPKHKESLKILSKKKFSTIETQSEHTSEK